MRHINTYSLVSSRHGGPSASALVGNLLGLGLVTQLLCDLATGALHVQEVWGQSTLGSVRVVGGSLALLLAITLDISEDAGRAGRSIGASEKAGLGENVGQVGVERAASAGGKDGVGMVDVCSGEVLDRSLEGSEGDNDLWNMLSNGFRSAVTVNECGHVGALIRKNVECITQ